MAKKERDYYCTTCRSVKTISKSSRNTRSSCSDCGKTTLHARADHQGKSGGGCIILIFALLAGLSFVPLATCHKDKPETTYKKQYDPGEKNPNFTEEDAPENVNGDSAPNLPKPPSLPPKNNK